MIYVYFLFPVKLKYFMGFLVLVQFFSTFSPYSDGIAHAAHLGGVLIGYVYLKYWYLLYKAKTAFLDMYGKGSKPKSNMRYTKGGGEQMDHYRKVVDDLLDKINRVGYLNLSDKEKKDLEEGSRYLRENDNSNIN